MIDTLFDTLNDSIVKAKKLIHKLYIGEEEFTVENYNELSLRLNVIRDTSKEIKNWIVMTE